MTADTEHNNSYKRRTFGYKSLTQTTLQKPNIKIDCAVYCNTYKKIGAIERTKFIGGSWLKS